MKMAEVVLAYSQTSEPYTLFDFLIPQICLICQGKQSLDSSQAAWELMQTVANRSSCSPEWPWHVCCNLTVGFEYRTDFPPASLEILCFCVSQVELEELGLAFKKITSNFIPVILWGSFSLQ